ncbi:MAG: glycosyltransferase WbuB [Bacteroidetes bacterium]|nr:MAG: glycosyltransferase WbuB [Bacteroidota bacterium]
MNILLIHQYFLEEGDFGGSRFNEMTKVWTSQGHEVTVLAGMMHANGSEKRPEYKWKYVVEKEQGKIKVFRCHVAESYNKNFIGRVFGYLTFMFSCLYAGLFKAKGNYDKILVTSPPLFIGLSGVLISKIKRIPLVFEIRDLWPESAIDSGVLKNSMLIRLAYWAERYIYKKASLINVLTPAFRDKLIDSKDISPEKIIYIPNACDFSLSDKILANNTKEELKAKMGWEGKRVFTYVGAHGIANHLIQILDAMEQIDDEKIIFNLIGSGMEKQRLQEIAQKKNIKNVIFIDPVAKDEVFKYIIASDFGASVLKKVDTFKTIYSNKTFDYMSCKTPVLLLIDGISRELINDAKCGRYVEPENTEQIVSMILDLASLDETEVRQMGDNGYQYALQHFDRQKLAYEYSELLEEKAN